MAPVVNMLSTNLVAVPARRRVEPVTIFRARGRSDGDVGGEGEFGAGVQLRPMVTAPRDAGVGDAAEYIRSAAAGGNADEDVVFARSAER